mgnify:CR=1 FL=1
MGDVQGVQVIAGYPKPSVARVGVIGQFSSSGHALSPFVFANHVLGDFDEVDVVDESASVVKRESFGQVAVLAYRVIHDVFEPL